MLALQNLKKQLHLILNFLFVGCTLNTSSKKSHPGLAMLTHILGCYCLCCQLRGGTAMTSPCSPLYFLYIIGRNNGAIFPPWTGSIKWPFLSGLPQLCHQQTWWWRWNWKKLLSCVCTGLTGRGSIRSLGVLRLEGWGWRRCIRPPSPPGSARQEVKEPHVWDLFNPRSLSHRELWCLTLNWAISRSSPFWPGEIGWCGGCVMCYLLLIVLDSRPAVGPVCRLMMSRCDPWPAVQSTSSLQSCVSWPLASAGTCVTVCLHTLTSARWPHGRSVWRQ